MNKENNRQSTQPTGLIRRVLAIVYDLILLIAMLFLATIIATLLNHGKAIEPDNPYYIFFVLSLLAISFFYYSWFWTHGGQTLGMKTWKIRLQSRDNKQAVSWQQSLIRAVTALVSCGAFGLGFLWALFNKKKHTWHDMASNTELIDLRTDPD